MKKLKALLPEYNLKTRLDLLELDAKYLSDLKNDPEAAEWLNKFNTEFVNASFNRHKNHLHRTKKEKRECYSRNNARNRCIYTREKAQGKLDSFEDIREQMESRDSGVADEYMDDLFDNDMEKLQNFKQGSDESDDSTNS